jgi:aspartate/methionine/tyrosine aminotransferase
MSCDGIESLRAAALKASHARKLFCEWVGDLALATPDGPSTLIALPRPMTSGGALKLLRERGILVSPGEAFDAPASTIRVTFSASVSVRVEEAAQVMIETLT